MKLHANKCPVVDLFTKKVSANAQVYDVIKQMVQSLYDTASRVSSDAHLLSHNKDDNVTVCYRNYILKQSSELRENKLISLYRKEGEGVYGFHSSSSGRTSGFEMVYRHEDLISNTSS